MIHGDLTTTSNQRAMLQGLKFAQMLYNILRKIAGVDGQPMGPRDGSFG